MTSDKFKRRCITRNNINSCLDHLKQFKFTLIPIFLFDIIGSHKMLYAISEWGICPYGICCPWVRGGWVLWGNSSVVIANAVAVLTRYVNLQSDNLLSLCSLLGAPTENVARVLSKMLANGDSLISRILFSFIWILRKSGFRGNSKKIL